VARGWESKSVEQQQEEAQRASSAPIAPLTPEQRERRQLQQQLRLAVALTEEELQRACHPRHRDMLRQRMEALRAQLENLSG